MAEGLGRLTHIRQPSPFLGIQPLRVVRNRGNFRTILVWNVDGHGIGEEIARLYSHFKRKSASVFHALAGRETSRRSRS